MSDWPITTIGKIAEVVTKGTTPTSIGYAFKDEGVNFIKVESIGADGSFIQNKLAHVDEECNAALKRSQLAVGDILFSIAGALGRTAIVTPSILPANTNQALAIIRLRSSNSILPTFIARALSSGMLIEQIEKHRGGVAQQNLSLAQVRGFQIPLPPLPEQKRIVTILDEAFEGIDKAIANTEKNLANARELFESYLNEVFTKERDGWAHNQLDELTDDDSKITYGVVKPGPEGEVPFIRGGDIVNGRIKIDQLRTITNEVSNKYCRTLLRGGEIVICLVGVPGQTAVVPKELKGANIARQVGLIRLKGAINPYFISFFLRSRIGLEGLGAYTGGSVQQVINLRDLKLVCVPLPDRSVQDDTVTTLDKIHAYAEQLERNYRKKLDCLIELKQSILQKAFAEELTAKPERVIKNEAVA